MKDGWHWKPRELAILRQYISARRSANVGWGSGRSDIQAIADKLGRDYFAVYRRLQRLVDETQSEKLPRPPRRAKTKLFTKSIVISMAEEFYEAASQRAKQLGMMKSEYARHLIHADLEAAKCSDAGKRAKG